MRGTFSHLLRGGGGRKRRRRRMSERERKKKKKKKKIPKFSQNFHKIPRIVQKEKFQKEDRRQKTEAVRDKIEKRQRETSRK